MRKDSSSSTVKYMRFVIRPVKYYMAIRSANIRVLDTGKGVETRLN